MKLPTSLWLAYICAPLIFVIGTATAVSAQTYTFGQGFLAAGSLPTSGATADLNGDGKLDLVIANLQDSTVSVFLGKPDGTFASAVTYPTGPNPSSVVLKDFNGDGYIDVVVTDENCAITAHISTFSCGAASISILLGNGDGTFRPRQDFPSASRPLSIQAADMNGDGKLDLIVGSDSATNATGSNIAVSVLLGNGDGTFQKYVDYANPQGDVGGAGISSWVVVADFNGDGNLDVATGYALPELNSGVFPAAVAVYLGSGDGTLQTPTSFSLQDQLTSASSAAAGDFNRDGKQDLAITTISGIEIFTGNGDGTFTFKGAGGGGFGALVAVDLNQDGKLDLVAAIPSATSNGLTAILGNGDGTFQTDTEFHMVTGIWPAALVLGDFNGDGRIDIVVTLANVAPPQAVTDVTQPAGSIVIFLGEGGNIFGGAVLSTTVGAANSVPAGLIATDLNGDGKLDLAFVNTGQAGSSVDNTVSVLLGKGDGTFHAQQTFATGTFPVDLQVADLNADGKPDLVVANQICALTATTCSAGSVSVLLSNGDGTFQMHQDFAVGVTPVGLTIADFNGNGKPGVAVVNNALGQGTSISVLTGKGDGTLNPHVDYTTPGPPTAISSGDFNHDGKIDVIVSSLRNSSPQAPISSTPNVSTFLGNGDGTFEQPVNSPVPTGSFIGPGYLLAPTDLDGDTNLDFVGGHIDDPAFGLFNGKGDGTFSNGGNTGGAFGRVVQAPITGLFALGDFNRDGHVDIALVDTTSTLVILQGDGQGSFQMAQRMLAPTAFDLSNRIAAPGDFNADGGLDLAVVQPSSASAPGIVSVYLNDAFKAVYPTSLAFGSQGLTTQSAVQTVTIHNPSATTFAISNISVSGPYTQTNNCGPSLSAQATCTVNVRFAPVAEGSASGALTLTDSTHASPQVIPMTGSGVNGSFLQLSATRLNLGSANIALTNGPQVVTIANTGNASLTIMNIGITGGNAADFAQSNTCGNSLAVGGTCTLSVTFTPSAVGVRASAVTITDNAPGTPHTVALTGSGLGPQVALTPASLTFATQSVGTVSFAQTVTLTNGGTAGVSITRISASGDFAQTNNCGGAVQAAGACQVSVTFAPTTGANRMGTLTVVTSVGLPQTVALLGTGVDFIVSTAGGNGPGTIATVTAGATATYPLSLTGGTGFTGTVALTCSGAPATASCTVSPASVTLTGTTAATATVSVTTTARSALFIPSGENREDSRWRMLIMPGGLGTLAVLMMLCVFAVSSRLKRGFIWAPTAAFSVFVLVAGVAISGCGGGSGNSPSNPSGGTGTAAGSYTITITATAGSGASAVSHATKLTLTVQ